MTKEVNEKTFSIFVERFKTFQLFINGFSTSTLWNIIMTNSLLMSASALLASKMTITLSLDNLRLVFETIKLTTKMTSDVVLAIAMDSVASLTYKITTTISNSLIINAFTIATVKVLSNIGLGAAGGRVKMAVSMLLVILNYLSDYDSGALSVMDTETLGDLDFTIL